MKLFVHGVPDTPSVWNPVLDVLALPKDQVSTPALPGFGAPYPNGFSPVKESYVDFVRAHAERLVERHGGPIDLISHDWGTLLSLRVASLHPNLFRTVTASAAFMVKNIGWHNTARQWQTPILGEAMMMLTSRARVSKLLKRSGLPDDLAAHEAAAFDGTMKRSILSLYRSATTMAEEWADDLTHLPTRTILYFGDSDPFVPIELARSFAQRWNKQLIEAPGAGHWAIVQNANEFAGILQRHWQEAD